MTCFGAEIAYYALQNHLETFHEPFGHGWDRSSRLYSNHTTKALINMASGLIIGQHIMANRVHTQRLVRVKALHLKN